MSDNIMERIAKREAEEKEFRYKQAKEVIYEAASQVEGMGDYIQIVRRGDYEREEQEKLNSKVFIAFIIGIPAIFMILTWNPIYLIVLFFALMYFLMGHFLG